MLVLTCDRQTSIRIGEAITVELVRIRGGRVHLGVTAPEADRVKLGRKPVAPRPLLPREAGQGDDR